LRKVYKTIFLVKCLNKIYYYINFSLVLKLIANNVEPSHSDIRSWLSDQQPEQEWDYEDLGKENYGYTPSLNVWKLSSFGMANTE